RSYLPCRLLLQSCVFPQYQSRASMDLLQDFHKNMILFSVGRFFCRGMSIDEDYHLCGSGQHQPVYQNLFLLNDYHNLYSLLSQTSFMFQVATPVNMSRSAVNTISNTPPPANSAHSILDCAPA